MEKYAVEKKNNFVTVVVDPVRLCSFIAAVTLNTCSVRSLFAASEGKLHIVSARFQCVLSPSLLIGVSKAGGARQAHECTHTHTLTQKQERERESRAIVEST